MLDLYSWAIQAERINTSGEIEGILLIDEIEQHLHPSMQAAAMKRLSEALPRMQVIATTHSPLVAMGVSPDEVVPLRREENRVVKEDAVPDFRGWSAEDLLVDDRLFDTSAYAPQTTEQLQKYQQLAEIPPEQRSSAEKNELKNLAQTLLKQQLPEVRESETSKDLKKLIEKHQL
jgi:predicted ATP-binding protein involved in virulence